MSDAVLAHPDVDILVNFASLRSAYNATIDAMKHSQVVFFVFSYLLIFN